MKAEDTVRYLPNEYRECADEDGVIQKYKIPVHEPSFKLGRKEVVDWVEDNNHRTGTDGDYAEINWRKWQAFKKSKGIE